MTPPASHKDIQTLADRLVLEHGRLDPFELLLAAGLLAYEDYEAWRMGRRPDLETALHGSAAQTTELLEMATDYARRLGLEPAPLAHRAWGGGDAGLTVGTTRGLVEACAQAWAPAADRAQLDLFQDSSEQLLEEAIRAALAERRVEEARRLTAELAREHPRHPKLPGFLHLIQWLDDGAHAGSHAAPADRVDELEALDPLARELLGYRARDLLTALWADLAERLDGQGFEPQAPRRHASQAWARAGRWEAVRTSIERVPDWDDSSALLMLHAEAAWRRRDLAAAREDWIWLCWEHPLEAERALGAAHFPDPWLARRWRDFSDLDEPLDTEDFPAWLLLQDAVGTRPVPPERAPEDERGDAYRLLHRIVSGGDDIELRRQLDEIHPVLLRAYLRRR